MIMIDLETLGTTPGSVIASLGAVKFDPATGRIGDTLYGTIDLHQSVMQLDADTVRWWLKQEEQARRDTFPDNPTWYLREALEALQDFYDGEEVWSHGATFDITQLEEAYRRLYLPIPWNYRDVRDTRTLFSLRPDIDVPFEGTVHNALYDAVYQARRVMAVWRELDV